MNILSRILKELAQEFRIPEAVDKNLFKRIFGQRNNKHNRITEKTNDGRTKKLSHKSAER